MSAAARSIRARLLRRLAPDVPAGEGVSLLLAFVAGIGTVFAFAPFGLAEVAMATLAVLFAQWRRAAPSAALRSGFAFGAGYFGTGVSWIYVALNTFGGMPAPFAAVGTAALCGYLALFPALAGWLTTRWIVPGSVFRLPAAAGAWVLCEWLRSFAFGGFPWLGIGYVTLAESAPGALGGYAPIGGVWLASLAVAGVAAALAAMVDALTEARRREIAAAALAATAIVVAGAALREVTWTTPAGAPVAISLVQGNVSQDEKFDPAMRAATFALYTDMVRASKGRIVVLPESALPAFVDEIPKSVLRDLFDVAAARHGSVLTGIFTIEPPLPGQQEPRYFNSVVALGDLDVQLYRKRHLVPFGETIPLEPIVGWFIRSVLSIPLANQSAGDADQPAFRIAGQAIAVNICYEDVFGPDIRPQAKNATILVNVTNDAWYGRSIAARQHDQIAAMRALETGRPLLRATNTGITSAIDADGRHIASLPWFTRGILEVSVRGTQGSTPYLRWGDFPAVVLAALVFGAAVFRARPRSQPHEAGVARGPEA